MQDFLFHLELKPQVYDCADLLKEGHTVSGVYNIYLNKAKRHIQVYCDMQTDGGGWLVGQLTNTPTTSRTLHDEIKCPGGGGCDNIINPGHSVRKAVKEQPFEFNRVTELSSR